ncbi:mannose-P-dolichol utilization defect 1 protein [Martensiomyces pterosporus]|nr:mannose-P-dolichol utilization defect 1 protein [Martensiomyces pterosporus]
MASAWLPGFLRNPIVALIGEECTVTLIDTFNILDSECLPIAISKGLGLGIVLGGCVVKLPQLFKILNSKSVTGISLSAYVLETLANIITIAYNYRKGYPFTTYGEAVFIGVQNYVITLLILLFTGRATLAMAVAALLLVFTYSLFDYSFVGETLLSTLYSLTIPLVVSSRIPQIYTIHKNKFTGQLSAFAVFNYFVGTAARLYTTLVEVDDSLVLVGTVLATVANGVLAAQMVYYWSAAAPKDQYSFELPMWMGGPTTGKKPKQV